MIHPFVEAELKAMNKSRRWYSGIADRLPWSEKNAIRARREGRLFDCWTADPDRSLLGGGVQGWEETLESITADGTQIGTSTVETIVCPDFNIPAYYMAPGRTLRIWAYGVDGTVVTTPGTLTMAVRWGGVAGTVLSQSAAQGLDTVAHAGVPWALFVHVVCRTAGATGTFLSGGLFWGNVLSTTAANLLPAFMCSTGTPYTTTSNQNASVTVNTTTANLLSVTAKFSVSNASNVLTCQSRLIEALN